MRLREPFAKSLFHFCLLDICWAKQRALWVSSIGSSFIVTVAAAEWAEVDTCAVNNEWMSEQAPCSLLGFSYQYISCLWMGASLILIYEGYSCFFMLSRVLISPKRNQKTWFCHKLGLWYYFHSWALVSLSIKQRARPVMVSKVPSKSSKLWQSSPKWSLFIGEQKVMKLFLVGIFKPKSWQFFLHDVWHFTIPRKCRKRKADIKGEKNKQPGKNAFINCLLWLQRDNFLKSKILRTRFMSPGPMQMQDLYNNHLSAPKELIYSPTVLLCILTVSER